MCGIAGLLVPDGEVADSAIARRMAATLAHRGPDGEGVFADRCCALGHRRLAVIDLSSAASQPMRTADGRFTLVYNGELYNYRELRAELEKEGAAFKSLGDTEVLLQALAFWGENAVSRFNGIFAFALWDGAEKTLLLGRDRYGVKPLYYAWQGDALLFGSEVRALLTHPDMSAGLDIEALTEYLTFQNYFTDRTLFEKVRMLPAGSTMRIRPGEPNGAKPRTYWDYRFREPEQAGDEREYVEELSRLFGQAVRRQLVSDVEVGSYLSGGLDSGSITAVAAGELPYMRTFTGGFDLTSASGLELGFDEREKAEFMSYLFRTEHYEVVLKSGDMERIMPSLVRSIEEPRVGQSYPNAYVAGLAGRFVTVCLSGTGGDELFAGYPWRYYRAVVNTGFDQYVDKYFEYWQRLVPAGWLKQVMAPVWDQASHVDLRGIFKSVLEGHGQTLNRPEDYVNHSLYLEAKTFLHGLLVVEDKLTMARGLEVRVPFLDNDLVDFAMGVPVGLKLGNLGEVVRLNENEPGPKTEQYYKKTRDGKLILRQVLGRFVPETISRAVKQGFSGPDGSWFKGESIDFVRRMLGGGDAAIYQVLDRNAISDLVDDHLEGRQNRRLLIWSLLNLELWMRTFLLGQTEDELAAAVRG